MSLAAALWFTTLPAHGFARDPEMAPDPVEAREELGDLECLGTSNPYTGEDGLLPIEGSFRFTLRSEGEVAFLTVLQGLDAVQGLPIPGQIIGTTRGGIKSLPLVNLPSRQFHMQTQLAFRYESFFWIPNDQWIHETLEEHGLSELSVGGMVPLHPHVLKHNAQVRRENSGTVVGNLMSYNYVPLGGGEESRVSKGGLGYCYEAKGP